MGGDQVTVAIAALVVLAFVPATLAHRKGYNAVTWYLAGLLGFLPAFVVALLLRPTGRYACAECGALIHPGSGVCPRCRDRARARMGL